MSARICLVDFTQSNGVDPSRLQTASDHVEFVEVVGRPDSHPVVDLVVYGCLLDAGLDPVQGKFGPAPIGIDEALASLRRSRLVELGFPVIRLTDVHWRKLGSSETTGFSIAALPKSKKKAKKGKK